MTFLRCALCHHTGLDVESRIVADDTELGYHREPRCVDGEACRERRIRANDPGVWPRYERITTSRGVEG